MDTIYIDESGYTGYDLLNTDQPFQAASAILIDEFEAKSLINEIFPQLQSSELKYKSLARRESNWEKLLSLQKELLQNHLCLTYICDKRYILLLHFINYAVEPFYYEKGINLYEDGGNYSLASLVYYTGNTLFGESNFNDLLHLFQKAMWSKSDVAVTALIQKTRSINWQQLPEFLGPLALQHRDCIDAIQTDGTSTDAALVVLLSLINRLEAIYQSDYRIKHDRSKNLEQYHRLLLKMINNTDSIELYSSKLATVKFPLKLKKVEQVDSKSSAGVQLADVLVGGIVDAVKAITGIKKNCYNEQIIGLHSDNQIIHLLPSIDFDEQIEFKKGTQANDIINYFAKMLS